jgi:hypothetical protein
VEPSYRQPEPPSSAVRILGKKKPVSPIALGGLIISSMATAIELDAEDQEFVNSELRWLFSATDNLLKISRREIERAQPVPASIPSDTEKLPEANNQLLKHVDEAALQFWQERTEESLKRINDRIKELDMLLDREASLGTAGKSDIALQNEIKAKRIEILKTLQEIVQALEGAYGVRITSPGQLVNLLREA